MNSAAIAAYTVQHGGGTFDRAGNPVEPVNGYAVGMARGSAAILPANTTPARLAETMRRIWQEFECNFVGTWVRDDGTITVDPVRMMTYLYAAMDAGKTYGQQAIYGFAERQAIEVQ